MEDFRRLYYVRAKEDERNLRSLCKQKQVFVVLVQQTRLCTSYLINCCHCVCHISFRVTVLYWIYQGDLVVRVLKSDTVQTQNL